MLWFRASLLGLWLGLLLVSPLWALSPEEAKKLKNPVVWDQTKLAYWTKQYESKCAGCHGINGDAAQELLRTYSSQQIQKMGLVIPADFTNQAYMQARTDGDLYRQILLGGENQSYMPAFGPDSDIAWSEEKIWNMVHYLRQRFQKAQVATN